MAEQHHPLVADKFVEVDGPIGSLGFEIWRFGSKTEADGTRTRQLNQSSLVFIPLPRWRGCGRGSKTYGAGRLSSLAMMQVSEETGFTQGVFT
jgi:hypothetical protein